MFYCFVLVSDSLFLVVFFIESAIHERDIKIRSEGFLLGWKSHRIGAELVLNGKMGNEINKAKLDLLIKMAETEGE